LIQSGSATDSDYQEDDRTSRTFFAKLSSDRGKHYALNPAIGYRFELSRKLSLTPAAGFGVSSQTHYLMDDQNLNSTYKTFWRGPFAQLETKLNANDKLDTRIGLRYHQVNYKAQADWNLIDAFMHPVSFEHIAKGYGIEADLQINYMINRSFAAYVFIEYNHWSTGTGIDELFLANGNVVKTRLNDVTRKGYSAGLGITYLIN
jgi:hypothetical protein